MWVPQDENVFKIDGVKDIDVCFVGTTNGYPTRKHYLNHLNYRGVPLYVSGGQREHALTIEGYAEVLRRSRISINFPDKSDGTIQAKCRIYESMLCGAMLLEKENNAISRWFTPMEDYVPFVNEDDLIDKIGYYLSRPQEMLQITLRALNKMRSNYSSKNWWVTVYEKAI
jgi:spore maturation protein CgeB